MSVDEEKVITTFGQRFFSAKSMDWINAENITAGDKLLSLDGENVEVHSIETYNESCDIHKISVDDYNNFFVTKHNILAHNYIYSGIAAASAVVARLPINISPALYNRIVSSISRAIPIIEKILVGGFSAFLTTHEITKKKQLRI